LGRVEILRHRITERAAAGGAMAPAAAERPIMEDLHFGFDRQRFLVRADLADDWRERTGEDAAARLVVLGSREESWTIPLRPVPDAPPPARPAGAEAAVDEILEAAVPLAGLGLGCGDEFRFAVELLDGGAVRERLPEGEGLPVVVPLEDFEQTLWDA